MNDNIKNYASSFESTRRIKPRIWDSDYCQLKALATQVRSFAEKYVSTDSTVLDIGCGAKPYQPLLPSACRYVGIDTGDNPFADISVGANGQIPLEDGLGNILISTQVVYLVENYPDYLSECRRLIDSNGVMLLTTLGTWTYHPASGGDYYRFTQDGVKSILGKAGFEVISLVPIVGTLGTGLHLRQIVFNSWLRRLRLGVVANLLNVFYNLRIVIEDRICPEGTRMAAPVAWSVIAKPVLEKR